MMHNNPPVLHGRIRLLVNVWMLECLWTLFVSLHFRVIWLGIVEKSWRCDEKCLDPLR